MSAQALDVDVLRTGGRDAFGDPLPGTEHPLEGATISPRIGQRPGSSEVTDRGETVVVGWTLFAPFDADLRATDQLRINTYPWQGVYDIVGEPGRWQSPFSGKKGGLEVALVRHGEG